MPPFVILGLPRSRTAWLSRFLSYGDWHCGHDELRHCRSLDDVKAWLGQPNTGTVETAGAPFWRLLTKMRPDVLVVTVRRPVADVVASLMACGFADEAALTAQMRRLDAKLDQIERRTGCLSVRFADLADEEVCAELFQHVLPYAHDPHWWHTISGVNVQINMQALVRYCHAHKAPIEKLRGQARQAMLADLSARPVTEPEALTIQQEDFATFYRDAKDLFKQHMLVTGQDIEDYSKKNLPLLQKLDELGFLQVTTARCNGRMFGYLMAVLSPSLDDPNVTSAMHLAFFADKSFHGLGMKLQRNSIAALKERGAGELFMRAGVRGSGPKMDVLYRRLGAEDFGQLFRLELV